MGRGRLRRGTSSQGRGRGKEHQVSAEGGVGVGGRMRSDPQWVDSGEEAEEPESAATGTREGVKDDADYPPDLPRKLALLRARSGHPAR